MPDINPFKKNRRFYTGIIFTVIEGLLSGCSYFSIYFILVMIQDSRAGLRQVFTITALLAGIFLIRLLCYGYGYTTGQLGGADVSRQIRLFLGDKFKKIPLSRFTRGQVGQYVNTMNSDVSSYENILTHKVGSITKNITLSVMLMGFVSSLYLPAGLILLLSNLLLLPELLISFTVVKRFGRRKNTVAAETVSSLVEYISGIQTFRSYGIAGTRNRVITDAMKEFSNVSYLYEAYAIPVGFGFNILHWLAVPLVILTSLSPWTAGALSNIDYLMICMMPVLMTRLTSAIAIDFFSYKNLLVSKKNILTIAAEPEEPSGGGTFRPTAHDIAFKQVGFSYNIGETVLRDASFHAANRKLTAIVGDSGSGKSTILNLIAKYYEPDCGEISIGGISTTKVPAEQVLRQISIVDQEVFLFNDTIRENIRHARPGATDEEVAKACAMANCSEFIEKMPRGYDTPAGENGNALSGGERQRLSIARAVLKNAPILLLDEATASLDIENELAVKQAIRNLLKEQKTVIMIAHTLAIIKGADQILVVSDGKICEAGQHQELLAQKGKYARMWAAEQQLSDF